MQTIKCVLVGDGSVGKSYLIRTYTTNKYPSDYLPTVHDEYSATVIVGGEVYTLSVHVTAGQEDYDRLRPLSYPQTDVFLICFSIDSYGSLTNVEDKWFPEVRHYCPDTPFLLIGLKCDLRDNPETYRKRNRRPVTHKRGEKLANKLKAVKYMECSSLTREGLKEVFEEAVIAASGTPGPDSGQAKNKCCILL